MAADNRREFDHIGQFNFIIEIEGLTAGLPTLGAVTPVPTLKLLLMLIPLLVSGISW
jgi:hypothetical protein